MPLLPVGNKVPSPFYRSGLPMFSAMNSKLWGGFEPFRLSIAWVYGDVTFVHDLPVAFLRNSRKYQQIR
jgi:hypothetical protein